MNVSSAVMKTSAPVSGSGKKKRSKIDKELGQSKKKKRVTLNEKPVQYAKYWSSTLEAELTDHIRIKTPGLKESTMKTYIGTARREFKTAAGSDDLTDDEVFTNLR